MKLYQVVTLAALALTVAAGAVLARPSMFPQTPAQIGEDLRNPNNTTYVPSNKGG